MGIVTGQALSPLMGRSEEGTVIHVQNTAELWGDDTWDAGYLWTDAVTNYDPLFGTYTASIVLIDDQAHTTKR